MLIIIGGIFVLALGIIAVIGTWIYEEGPYYFWKVYRLVKDMYSPEGVISTATEITQQIMDLPKLTVKNVFVSSFKLVRQRKDFSLRKKLGVWFFVTTMFLGASPMLCFWHIKNKFARKI